MFMCKINVHYHCPERFPDTSTVCVCKWYVFSLSLDHFAAIHNAMHNIKISLESIEATVLIIKVDYEKGIDEVCVYEYNSLLY